MIFGGNAMDSKLDSGHKDVEEWRKLYWNLLNFVYEFTPKMESRIYYISVLGLVKANYIIAMTHGWKVHTKLLVRIIYKFRIIF